MKCRQQGTKVKECVTVKWTAEVRDWVINRTEKDELTGRWTRCSEWIARTGWVRAGIYVVHDKHIVHDIHIIRDSVRHRISCEHQGVCSGPLAADRGAILTAACGVESFRFGGVQEKMVDGGRVFGYERTKLLAQEAMQSLARYTIHKSSGKEIACTGDDQ